MKITAVKCLLFSAPCATPDDAERELHLRTGYRSASTIKVKTDSSLYGLDHDRSIIKSPLPMCFLLAVVTTGFIRPIRAESPAANSELCEIVDVFSAGDHGYLTYRIPSLAVSPQGTLLAVCAARKTSHKDWGNIDIAMRRSKDQGKTWDDFHIIVDVGEEVADNPTLICDQSTGHIHMLYQVGYARCFHIVSEDDGLSWSVPIDITHVFDKYRTEDNYPWEVIAVGPGHGIQLSNGRFIVPVWLATDHSHRPSISSTIYSDNHGKTWHRGDVVLSNTEEMPNPSESVALELADGRIMLNSRCESGRFRRVVSYSEDGATGWTQPRFQHDLFDPVCMASLARLSKANTGDKNRILFSNPNSEHMPNTRKGKRERINLTIRLSYDEGDTWPVSRQLVAGNSGYSDLAVGANDLVYCLFENQNLNDDPLLFIPRKISLARVNLQWITHGQDQIETNEVSDEIPQ